MNGDEILSKKEIMEIIEHLENGGDLTHFLKIYDITHTRLCRIVKRHTGLSIKEIKFRKRKENINKSRGNHKHPCGASKEMRVCFTQCYNAWKCDAAKNVGVKKDQNGCTLKFSNFYQKYI